MIRSYIRKGISWISSDRGLLPQEALDDLVAGGVLEADPLLFFVLGKQKRQNVVEATNVVS
jgi:hypothetical protein